MTGALRSDATALEAVVALLGPAAGPDGPRRRYAVVPSRQRPRYLLPASGRSGAGAHLRPGRGRRAAAERWAVRRALRIGAGRLLPGGVDVPDGTDRDPGLRRHLAALLGEGEVEVAVALGGPRPNRKPVLQVLAPDGRTLAWAKLGVDEHTDALVTHEARALEHRPGPPLVTPRVLATDSWQDHPLLVLAHMEMTETADDLALTAEVLRALAGPVGREGAATGAWWAALERDLEAGVDPHGAVAARLARLRTALGDRTWPFGRWHGDLAPWNATWDGDALRVWDWERAGGPVPVGLDAVHAVVQVGVLRDGLDLPAVVARARRTTADLLVEVGHDRGDVALVVDAYLATLRVRLAGDARLGSLGPATALAAALDEQATGEEDGR